VAASNYTPIAQGTCGLETDQMDQMDQMEKAP